jgi:hypothetical protein
MRGLSRPRVDELSEALEAAVVSAFDVVRKAACGELFHAEVVLEAIAADAVAWAAWVGAIAEFQVARLLAFHNGRGLRFCGRGVNDKDFWCQSNDDRSFRFWATEMEMELG